MRDVAVNNIGLESHLLEAFNLILSEYNCMADKVLERGVKIDKLLDHAEELNDNVRPLIIVTVITTTPDS